MYRKVLVALTGGDADQPLLDHVRQLAMEMRAELTLLRVIAVAEGGGGGFGKQFQVEIGSSGWRRRNEAEAYLSRLEGQLRHAGLSVDSALVIGTRSEGDEIVHYAAEGGYDLIAMAADTRPWYKRLIRSAQDDDVLRKANVPTLFLGDGSRPVPAMRTAPRAPTAMAVLGSAELWNLKKMGCISLVPIEPSQFAIPENPGVAIAFGFEGDTATTLTVEGGGIAVVYSAVE